jgi:hypothetical protein
MIARIQCGEATAEYPLPRKLYRYCVRALRGSDRRNSEDSGSFCRHGISSPFERPAALPRCAPGRRRQRCLIAGKPGVHGGESTLHHIERRHASPVKRVSLAFNTTRIWNRGFGRPVVRVRGLEATLTFDPDDTVRNCPHGSGGKAARLRRVAGDAARHRELPCGAGEGSDHANH